MTIRRKLFFLCSILAVLGMLVSVVWYRTARDITRLYLNNLSQSAMRDAYNAFDYILTDTQHMCTMIALNEENVVDPLAAIEHNVVEVNGVLNGTYLQNQRILKEFISSMNGYKYYIVGIDIVSCKGYRFTSGHIVQNYDKLSEMIAETDEQQLRRSMVMLSPLRVDNLGVYLTSDFVVPSVRAVLDSNRELVGYTVLYFDYSVIEQMFSDHLPEGSLFQVQNDRQDMIFTNCGDAPLQTRRDDDDYVYSTYAAPQAGWTLHMMIPSAVYTREIQHGLYYSGGLVIAVFLLAFGIAMAISRRINAEIAGFRNAMHQVGQGDLDVRYTFKTRDEIAVMASTFNHMVARLKKLMNEVAVYERQKQDMQLKLLQAQINPHFVSNTLNVVAWMAKVQHADSIIPLTNALSRLLRSVMRQSERFVPLSAELDYVKSYLEIMEYSGNYQFEVEYAVEEDCQALFVPRFILQPVVENALVHGFSHSLSSNNLLRIAARVEEDRLLITVEDNGAGMTDAQIRALMTESRRTGVSVSSIGVPNVMQRIRMECDEPFGLQYTSEIGRYTRAIFTLPVRYRAEEEEEEAAVLTAAQERRKMDEQDPACDRG